MVLSPGARVGPYEIESMLGSGGMGEVYRARDTRLQRIVAIKILPPHLSANADLRQRFEREARAISSITHPNICALYDIGIHNGSHYLVMEFVEGETLADQLGKGAMKLELALECATQIADALDHAHRQGIIHRDLKPANLILTRSGLKLLDFGLARFKTHRTVQLPQHAVSGMQTEEANLTAEGAILGTIAYMSPEQLEGREVDARSDLFSLGALLYEMATGRRAFGGESQAKVIARILSSEPEPILALLPSAPPTLDRVVRTCLAKDPDDRWQTAHDLMLQLKWMAASATATDEETRLEPRRIAAASPAAARRRRLYPWLLAFLVVSIVLALGAQYMRTEHGELVRTMRFAISPPQNLQFNLLTEGAPAVLSPDGHALVFGTTDATGRSLLWIQRIGELSATPLEGTEEGSYPFWSSDSKSIGFFARGKLKTVDASGGSAVTICDAPRYRGGTWNGDVILFSPGVNSPIYRVSAMGGVPRPVTRIDQNKHGTHRWPWFLPDGRHFIYLAANQQHITENDGIYFASLDGKSNHLVVRSSSNGIVASNHLLFLRDDGVLMSAPFDARRGQITDDPVAVAQDVHYDAATWLGYFSASDNGLLVLHPREPIGAIAPTRLLWFDRSGKQEGSLGDPASYFETEISPDNRQLLARVGDPGVLWLFDVGRGTGSPLIRDSADDTHPVWSHDHNMLAYASNTSTGNSSAIWIRSAEVGSRARMVFNSQKPAWPTDWSPDGRFLAVTEADSTTTPGANSDIYLLPADGSSKPIPFLTDPFQEDSGRFSLDGRWMSYVSWSSGRPEVCVVPFDPARPAAPAVGRKVQISIKGGYAPRWRGDGKELFFMGIDKTLMDATLGVKNGQLAVLSLRPLFKTAQKQEASDFSVTNDGQKFLINSVQSANTAPITLVLNWNASLKQ